MTNTNLEDVKKTIETKKSPEDLIKLYNTINTRENWQSEYQKQLQTIFDNSKFDKQDFLSKLLKDRTSISLFQMASKKQNQYTRNLDGLAGSKSQTKKLAEDMFLQLVKNRKSTENKGEKKNIENYVKLDQITKQKLINMWQKEWKILEQLGANEAILLKWIFPVKIDKFDTTVSELKLSYISQADIASMNLEISENMTLSLTQAQNFLNKKYGGKYILCFDCKPINQYISDDYEYIAWDNGKISKEQLTKMPDNMLYTQKKLLNFISKAENNPKLKNAKPIFLWSNNYGFFKKNEEIMTINVNSISDPTKKIPNIIKLDISSM